MQRQIGILSAAGVLLLVGFIAFMRLENPLAWGLIPVLIGSAWMLGDPRRLLAGYWLWASVQEYVYQIVGVGFLRYGDEALLGLIAVALIFDQAMRRRSSPELRPMFVIFTVLMVLYGASYMVNGGSALRVAVTAVQYFRPFVLGYVAYVFFQPKDLPGVIYVFMATLLLQLAVNVSWLVGLNVVPNPGIYSDYDWAVGLMGSPLYVGYTACVGIVVALALAISLRRWTYPVLVLLLFISFVLTNTLNAYAFLAITIPIVVLLPARRAVSLLGLGSFTLLGLVFVALLLGALMPDLLSLDHYLERGSSLLTGRKMDSYVRHVKELPSDVPVFLLGAGPANLGCAMVEQDGYLATKYHGWGFEYSERMERVGGSLISHTRTGLLSIWGDLGPVAFLLYWGAHFYAAARITRNIRRELYQDPYQKALAAASVAVMAFYLGVASLVDIIHLAFWGCLPWIFVGLVWRPHRDAVVLAEAQADEVSQTEEEEPVALQV